MSGNETSPMENARPLFLLGAPRSGTTFCAKLLNTHSRVLMTNEVRAFTFFEHAINDIPKGDSGGLHCSRVHGDEFVSALRAAVRSIVEDTYRKIAEKTGKTNLAYWGDKNPHFASCLDLVDGAFPEAVYIRMRRDPRDILCSILEMKGVMGLIPERPLDGSAWGLDPEEITSGSQAIAKNITTTTHFLEQIVSSRFMAVSYEALTTDPEGSLDEVCRFLGIAEDLSSKEWLLENARRDSHSRFIGERDFSATSIGRWKTDLDQEQITLARVHLERVISAEGYA